jgi:hypothetical protein
VGFAAQAAPENAFDLAGQKKVMPRMMAANTRLGNRNRKRSQ